MTPEAEAALRRELHDALVKVLLGHAGVPTEVAARLLWEGGQMALALHAQKQGVVVEAGRVELVDSREKP